MKSVLENGGLAQLWSSLPLKFCKIFFKNSSPASRTNPPEQIFKKKFQKNYWFDVVIRLEKSPKMTTTSLMTISFLQFHFWPRHIFNSQKLTRKFCAKTLIPSFCFDFFPFVLLYVRFASLYFRFASLYSILKKKFALFASLRFFVRFASLRFMGEKKISLRFAFSILFWAIFICLILRHATKI